MGSKILVINIGSASKKYSVYDGIDELVFFHFEKNFNKFILSIKSQNGFEKDKINENDYDKSLEFVCNYLKENFNTEIDDFYVLSFRVVAPSSYFLEHREIDENYIKELNKVKSFANLHIEPVLEEIQKAKNIFSNQKFLGISDSAFFKNKLEESKYYGISKDLQDKYDMKRFGYHGISVESVLEKIKNKGDLDDKKNQKILICHLGGGISITGALGEKILDNSMGFSPLEGPVMATRSGNVDFSLLTELFKKVKMKNSDEQLKFLNEQSGILGLSGISSDLRVLKEEIFKGNPNAKFAIKVYLHNLLKEIGKMVAVLKGVDLFVFTGTIGFRSDFFRELVLENLRWLNLNFDLEKNAKGDINGDYFFIESFDSKVKILVCETDEMYAIVKITLKIC